MSKQTQHPACSPYVMLSVMPLIIVNIATIVFAVVQDWSLPTLLWGYWAQSIIIGFFQVRKLLDLKNFSVEGFKINNKQVPPTEKTKRRTARFFVFHYGFFHFVYALFLGSIAGITDWRVVGVIAIGFFVNHWFSYRSNKDRDRRRVFNIGTVMFFPYLRILPMHLTIIFIAPFAFAGAGSLIFFLGLKTLADIGMHVMEHGAWSMEHRA